MSGFGDLADARVIIIIIIIAGLCEGQIHTGLCLASHAGPYNVAMSRPNANGRIPSFYSGGLAVMTNKSTTCQPPSRIKTWDRNICSDGRSNPTKCGWRHHLLYISGFGDLADARVIIIEGHIHTGLCLAIHAGPYNVAMSRPNANVRIPSFYSGGLAVS